MTGLRRQLSEPKTVVLSELTQMPESPLISDVGDLERMRIGSAKVLVGPVQSACLHESRWRHPVALYKRIVQGSFAGAGDATKRRDREYFGWTFLDRRDSLFE